MPVFRLVIVAVYMLMSSRLSAAEPRAFRFEPVGDQVNVPERYRLQPRAIDYELNLKHRLPATGVEIHRLTFASPVTSPHTENNTVHAEYYRPAGDGPFPAVIVLDITGGDQTLSRAIATFLAQNKIAGLFVQMAYYGPRRPTAGKVRLLSTDVPRTIAGVTQTVLDCRCAAAWLTSRPEVDAKRVGILGTSLGSFVAALTAEMEPRLTRTALLLGGGGLVDAFYDHPQAKPYRQIYETLGGTKDAVKAVIAPVDPLTCAANLRGRNVLMFCASRDEIVPPSAAKALWEAAGQPKIVWYDTTHYGAALYILKALPVVVEHFK